MTKRNEANGGASTDEATGKTIYTYKIESGDTWDAVGAHFNMHSEKARKRARDYYTKHGQPPPHKARIVGGFDQEPHPNGKDLWQRAISIQKRQAQSRDYQATRRVIFDEGPVVLIAMADLHLGGQGINYLSIDEDIRLIHALYQDGVSLAVVLVGDLLDNFIIGRLKDLRLVESPFLAIEEWGLVDYALERLAPFLVGSVAGNHDNWSWALAGIDLLRQRHSQLTPGILYDPYELSFVLQVGNSELKVMARHGWRGNSMYNPTHGLEHKQHTLGRTFDIAIGGHTHRGGLAREFNNGSGVGYALLCGSYKEEDSYAMRLGFPPPLNTSAVAVVVDDDGVLFATSNLYALPRLLGG